MFFYSFFSSFLMNHHFRDNSISKKTRQVFIPISLKFTFLKRQVKQAAYKESTDMTLNLTYSTQLKEITSCLTSPLQKYKEEPFFFNYCFDKNRLKNLINWYLLKWGENQTITVLDQLKQIGFEYATLAGISLSIEDLKISPTKADLISSGQYQVYEQSGFYQSAFITSVEKYQHLIETWHRTSEKLKQNVVQYLRTTDPFNPIYMMAFSGARGNISQVRQLVGMRGLMADPQGQIIHFPIQSNFREGLTLAEYLISCFGARKGLVDTALRTATSGYLTRRLVDVAHHEIICLYDCDTYQGIPILTTHHFNKSFSIQERLIGRVLAKKMILRKDPQTRLNVHLKTKASSLYTRLTKRSSTEPPFFFRFNNIAWFSVSFKKPIYFQIVIKFLLHQKTSFLNSHSLRVQPTLIGYKRPFLTYFVKSRKKDEEVSLKDQKEVLTLEKSGYKNHLLKKLLMLNDFEKSIVLRRNQEIFPDLAVQLSQLKTNILIRSPLTCQSPAYLCQLCYGWGLTTGQIVSLGEAVGIIAAQSIGEPGTQLTMRTFHTGGVFTGEIIEQIQAPFTGFLTYQSALAGELVRTLHGQIGFLTKQSGILEFKHKTDGQTKELKITPFTLLFIRNGELVKKNQLIAESTTSEIHTQNSIISYQRFNSLLNGEVFFKQTLTLQQRINRLSGSKLTWALKYKKIKPLNQTFLAGQAWVLAANQVQPDLITSLNCLLRIGDFVNQASPISQLPNLAPYSIQNYGTNFVPQKLESKINLSILQLTNVGNPQVQGLQAFNNQNRVRHKTFRKRMGFLSNSFTKLDNVSPVKSDLLISLTTKAHFQQAELKINPIVNPKEVVFNLFFNNKASFRAERFLNPFFASTSQNSETTPSLFIQNLSYLSKTNYYSDFGYWFPLPSLNCLPLGIHLLTIAFWSTYLKNPPNRYDCSLKKLRYNFQKKITPQFSLNQLETGIFVHNKVPLTLLIKKRKTVFDQLKMKALRTKLFLSNRTLHSNKNYLLGRSKSQLLKEAEYPKQSFYFFYNKSVTHSVQLFFLTESFLDRRCLPYLYLSLKKEFREKIFLNHLKKGGQLFKKILKVQQPIRLSKQYWKTPITTLTTHQKRLSSAQISTAFFHWKYAEKEKFKNFAEYSFNHKSQYTYRQSNFLCLFSVPSYKSFFKPNLSLQKPQCTTLNHLLQSNPLIQLKKTTNALIILYSSNQSINALNCLKKLKIFLSASKNTSQYFSNTFTHSVQHKVKQTSFHSLAFFVLQDFQKLVQLKKKKFQILPCLKKVQPKKIHQLTQLFLSQAPKGLKLQKLLDQQKTTFKKTLMPSINQSIPYSIFLNTKNPSTMQFIKKTEYFKLLSTKKNVLVQFDLFHKPIQFNTAPLLVHCNLQNQYLFNRTSLRTFCLNQKPSPYAFFESSFNSFLKQKQLIDSSQSINLFNQQNRLIYQTVELQHFLTCTNHLIFLKKFKNFPQLEPKLKIFLMTHSKDDFVPKNWQQFEMLKKKGTYFSPIYSQKKKNLLGEELNLQMQSLIFEPESLAQPTDEKDKEEELEILDPLLVKKIPLLGRKPELKNQLFDLNPNLQAFNQKPTQKLSYLKWLSKKLYLQIQDFPKGWFFIPKKSVLTLGQHFYSQSSVFNSKLSLKERQLFLLSSFIQTKKCHFSRSKQVFEKFNARAPIEKPISFYDFSKRKNVHKDYDLFLKLKALKYPKINSLLKQNHSSFNSNTLFFQSFFPWYKLNEYKFQKILSLCSYRFTVPTIYLSDILFLQHFQSGLEHRQLTRFSKNVPNQLFITGKKKKFFKFLSLCLLGTKEQMPFFKKSLTTSRSCYSILSKKLSVGKNITQDQTWHFIFKSTCSSLSLKYFYWLLFQSFSQKFSGLHYLIQYSLTSENRKSLSSILDTKSQVFSNLNLRFYPEQTCSSVVFSIQKTAKTLKKNTSQFKPFLINKRSTVIKKTKMKFSAQWHFQKNEFQKQTSSNPGSFLFFDNLLKQEFPILDSENYENSHFLTRKNANQKPTYKIETVDYLIKLVQCQYISNHHVYNLMPLTFYLLEKEPAFIGMGQSKQGDQWLQSSSQSLVLPVWLRSNFQNLMLSKALFEPILYRTVHSNQEIRINKISQLLQHRYIGTGLQFEKRYDYPGSMSHLQLIQWSLFYTRLGRKPFVYRSKKEVYEAKIKELKEGDSIDLVQRLQQDDPPQERQYAVSQRLLLPSKAELEQPTFCFLEEKYFLEFMNKKQFTFLNQLSRPIHALFKNRALPYKIQFIQKKLKKEPFFSNTLQQTRSLIKPKQKTKQFQTTDSIQKNLTIKNRTKLPSTFKSAKNDIVKFLLTQHKTSLQTLLQEQRQRFQQQRTFEEKEISQKSPIDFISQKRFNNGLHYTTYRETLNPQFYYTNTDQQLRSSMSSRPNTFRSWRLFNSISLLQQKSKTYLDITSSCFSEKTEVFCYFTSQLRNLPNPSNRTRFSGECIPKHILTKNRGGKHLTFQEIRLHGYKPSFQPALPLQFFQTLKMTKNEVLFQCCHQDKKQEHARRRKFINKKTPTLFFKKMYQFTPKSDFKSLIPYTFSKWSRGHAAINQLTSGKFSKNWLYYKKLKWNQSNPLLLDQNQSYSVDILALQSQLLTLGSFHRFQERLSQSNKVLMNSGQLIGIEPNRAFFRYAQNILFASESICHVETGDLVQKNATLVTLSYKQLKTEDIVQGIPKIEEILEARQTKEGEPLLINLNSYVARLFQKFRSEGFLIATKLSFEVVQIFIARSVQDVYQAQGVLIYDKHLEIIIRQMTLKVRILDGGWTDLLRDEIVPLNWLEKVNQALYQKKGVLATYEPIVLGITRAALETNSFISAASFQETTRILGKAAIERQTDFLKGLKENVILGNRIPAGTGFFSVSTQKLTNLNLIHKNLNLPFLQSIQLKEYIVKN